MRAGEREAVRHYRLLETQTAQTLRTVEAPESRILQQSNGQARQTPMSVAVSWPMGMHAMGWDAE
jgi:hypothetical protein